MNSYKQIRLIDIALQACRKRQSPRTGFLHFYPQDYSVSDTIPLYENFCFALALFRQKTTESVLEGKEIIEKLLCFQTDEGNFPTFLHEFPKTWDYHLGLKIAPVFIHILKEFGSVVSASFKEKLEHSLKKMIRPPKNPSWDHRYQALIGQRPTFPDCLSSQELFDWIVSDQLFSSAQTYPIPFNSVFQLFLGSNYQQEKNIPKPAAIEYLLAEKDGYSQRLLADHPEQIYTALLYPCKTSLEEICFSSWTKDPYRLFWNGTTLHSLFVTNVDRIDNRFIFNLSTEADVSHDDLFEALVFCDISPETTILINGQKGMVFYLNDTISILSKGFQIDIQFVLVSGKGEFCGHISRSNRPGQISCVGENLYHAYDWQIGLRTLRRDSSCVIEAIINEKRLF